MAKKVIRLTEADIQKIVDKIITEQNETTSDFMVGPEMHEYWAGE